MKLQGNRLYLAVLEKDDCRKIWDDFEYDFQENTEPLNIGHSITKADNWFDEIQKNQGEKNIRLGVFLLDGSVIGDVALQDIDWKNRSSSIGLGIAKMCYRGQGYGSEAVGLILEYGFNNIGLERIWAHTLEHNKRAQNSLIKNGFILEGTERQAVYFAGRKWDRLNYGLLREEYIKRAEG